MGQRLQRPKLDAALCPSLVRGQGGPVPQHGERLLGCLLGKQHPSQDQGVALTRVAWPVLDGEATLLDPEGGGVDLAVGQGQLDAHRRCGVEQADHCVAQLDLLGLSDRLQGAGAVTLDLPDPRQDG